LRDIRPKSLSEFIGQEHVKEAIFPALLAAKKMGTVPKHMLMAGPPGLGKTTLSEIIATELGLKFMKANAPSLESPLSVINMLMDADKTIIFVDEVHRLPIIIQEQLYPALEDGKIHVEHSNGTFEMDLKEFCFVGATTEPAQLTKPFLDRITYKLEFELYSPEELTQIVKRAGIASLTDEEARIIGERGRGTPRVAINIAYQVEDFKLSGQKGTIEDFLSKMGIDENGLDRLQRRYVRALLDTFDGGPAGVNAIANTIGENVSTIETLVEPYLLYAGFVARKRIGRVATRKLKEVYGNDKEDQEGM